MRIMSCASAATPIWMRAIAVLLVLSLVGCAGTSNARTYGSAPATHGSEPGPWPYGASMAIAEGYLDKKLFDHEAVVAKRADGPLVQSAGGGAVVGVVGGAVVGGLQGVAQGIACGPLFVVCAPILAVVGAALGGVIYGVKGAQAGAQYAARYAGDESKDTGKAKQSSAMTSDAKAALQVIEAALPSLPPVPDRVKRLVAPSEQPEYLIEFIPPEVRFVFVHLVEKSGEASNKPEEHALFDISVQARVVRLSDKAVLDRRLVVENVSVSAEELAAPQTTATANAITAKVDAALDLCAARIADYWKVPAIDAIDKEDASETTPADAVFPVTGTTTSESETSPSLTAATGPGDGSTASAAPATSATIAAEPAPMAAARGLTGTLVITDALTKIEKTVSVTVVETNAEQTVYSTGDIIDKDGNILQLRVGDHVASVVSGALWNVGAKAGMQGRAKLTLDANGHGEVSWKVIAAGEGRFRVDAATYLQIEGTQYSGQWRLDYANGGPLPESHSGHHRSSHPPAYDGFSAKLTTR